ncbi:hypothetical protein CJ030_MR2G024229 [Morella rubra]|uniref:Late embryogenesis abundant protein LEA-2 subgroup domain-containing protein n=1 Tax=Morella rubra TaxID=262757 RepID=A0A6A1WPG3_9ROSI|nr:hypothetical protein CJ030_MR2G024684 [Morella rubra]KAB1224711.1 hypothetical protein CJ030_MR2G024229 [Morella rubra]
MKDKNDQVPYDTKRMTRRRCLIAAWVSLLLLVLLFIIILILALTVFKPKPPRIQLLSVTVDGVAPRVSLPLVQVQLNLTLDLELLVDNQNHASFKRGQGNSLLLYKSNQVGEADILPGLTPAMRSSQLACRLRLEVDELASNLTSLISDVLGGELVMETQTSIPGRISFLGIFRKHMVAKSDCQLTIAIPDMTIRKQTCKHKTWL